MNKNIRSSVAILVLAAVGICSSLKQSKDKKIVFNENMHRVDSAITINNKANKELEELMHSNLVPEPNVVSATCSNGCIIPTN